MFTGEEPEPPMSGGGGAQMTNEAEAKPKGENGGGFNPLPQGRVRGSPRNFFEKLHQNGAF